MSDPIPSVTAQGVAAQMVRPTDPSCRNYNSGLTRKGDRLYLATRHFNQKSWLCDIVINELVGDEARKVCVLALPRPHGREWHEDARLFWHNQRLYCAYTEGQYWCRPVLAIQRLALLRDDWSIERVITVGYGNNTISAEKNWAFFSSHDQLHFIYRFHPYTVIALDDRFEPVHTYLGGWRARLKHLRGGSPPVLVDDLFVTFPHRHIHHVGRKRRYSFNALAFEAAPPFRVIGVTKTLISGSGDDPTLPNLAYPHWHPIVVFPCGSILTDGNWTVCAGINDSYDCLFHFPRGSLAFE